jgi:hypothetical protein
MGGRSRHLSLLAGRLSGDGPQQPSAPAEDGELNHRCEADHENER